MRGVIKTKSGLFNYTVSKLALKNKGAVSLSKGNEYVCKSGFVIAGLTRNLLRLEKIAGQARNDEVHIYSFFCLTRQPL